jgi:hypothetical protein
MSTYSNDEFFNELCKHLPGEERMRVLAVWKDISDGGDASLYAKLLTLHFAADSRVLVHVDKRTEAILTALSNWKDEQIALSIERKIEHGRELPSVILDILPKVCQLLQLEAIADGAVQQQKLIKEMSTDIKAVRRVRITGLSLLLVLGTFLGSGSTAAMFWRPYHSGQRFSRWVSSLEQRGVGISFSESATESLLKIDAENGNIGWTAQKNTVGKNVSLRVELPKRGGR